MSSHEKGSPHYKEIGIEPWEVIDRAKLDFYEGNVLKYLLRWRRKDGIADLKKAIHYLEKLIEKEGESNG